MAVAGGHCEHSPVGGGLDTIRLAQPLPGRWHAHQVHPCPAWKCPRLPCRGLTSRHLPPTPLPLARSVSYELERHSRSLFLNQREALQASAAKAKLQLEIANRDLDAKRAMVRHISHEIRTPLNITAIGMDTMLRALQKLPPTKTVSFLRETIGSCRVACDDALTIVSDLLDFEKLAAGMFTLEKVLTSLVQWVGELLKPFRVSALSKGVTLEFVHPDAEAGQPAPVVADIDPLKMATVVRNLLSNAIKFSDTG